MIWFIKICILIFICGIFLFLYKLLKKNWVNLTTYLTFLIKKDTPKLFFYGTLLVFMILTILPIALQIFNEKIFVSYIIFVIVVMVIVFLIYIFWYWKKYQAALITRQKEHRGEKLKTINYFGIMYIFQAILLLCLFIGNYIFFKDSFNNTFPLSLFSSIKDTNASSILVNFTWIATFVFMIIGILYIYRLYKPSASITNTDKQKLTSSQIVGKNMIFLIIFLIFTKLFFFKTGVGETLAPGESTKEANNVYIQLLSSVSYIGFAYLVMDLFLVFMGWNIIQLLEMGFMYILLGAVFIGLLFSLIKKNVHGENYGIKNDKAGELGQYNNVYVVLLVLFIVNYCLLFITNWTYFTSQSYNYLYFIIVIVGIIALFILSLLLNNSYSGEKIIESSPVKNIVPLLLGTIFIGTIVYFTRYFLNLAKQKMGGPKSNDSFSVGSVASIGVLIAVFVGLYYLMKTIFTKNSYASLVPSVVLMIICFVIFSYLIQSIYKIFNSHTNPLACSPNPTIVKWRQYAMLIFFIIGIVISNKGKKITTPASTDDDKNSISPLSLLIIVVFIIIGYYVGGYAYNVRNTQNLTMLAADDKDPTQIEYCKTIINVHPKLNAAEVIKIIIMISMIFLLVIFLNKVTNNIMATKFTSNEYTTLFLVFVMYMIFLYLKISSEDLLTMGIMFRQVFSSKYSTSSNSHKFNDGFFIVFLLFIILSVFGLIEKLITTDVFKIQIYKKYIQPLLKNSSVISSIFFIMATLFNIIMYIPCLLQDLFDEIIQVFEKKPDKSIIIVLIVEIVLIVLYVFYRKLISIRLNHGGSLLLNNPKWLSPSILISPSSTDEGIAGNVPETVIYKYAISFWVFIDQDMNQSSFINILNYNNSPHISYKPSANDLMFTTEINPDNVSVTYKKQGIETDNTLASEIIKSFTSFNNATSESVNNKKVVYSDMNILLQKWNHIVVNYNDSVIDIFINGNLVSSTDGNMILPDNYSPTIILGDDVSSSIRVCNLLFFTKALPLKTIEYLYESAKMSDPPINTKM